MKNISKNITFENWIDYKEKQFFKIENTPNKEQIKNGKLIAENIFEKLVTEFGEIIKIENGFINYDLGKKISQGLPYYNGDALKISSEKSGEIFNYIKDNFNFDVLIWLFGTEKNPKNIYVSYNSDNRKIILKTSYNKEEKKIEYIDYEPTAI